MMSEQIINNLKASLFELTYIIDNYRRKEIMDMLCVRVKKLMDAEKITVYMYNKWQLDQHINHYASTYPVSCYKHLTDDNFMTLFQESPTICQDSERKSFLNSENTMYLLKIMSPEKFYGFIIIEFKKEKVITHFALEKSRMIIEQFLRTLYTNRHHKFIQDRDKKLSRLSNKLHSVHRTVDVLEKVYRKIHCIYPTFEYSFIMSQELNHPTIPIQVIEYSRDIENSPGLIAFMNNELQIQKLTDQNEMNIYSPLSGSQGVYGVFRIKIPRIIKLVKEELDFIQNFTTMVGRAIERTTLYQSSNQLVSDLQIINHATQELNTNLKINDITMTVKKLIFDSCNAEQIGIAIFSEEAVLDVEILHGSTDYFQTIKGKDFMKYAYEKMKKNPQASFTGDFQSEEIKNIPFNSVMIIPMRVSEDIFGVIVIAHRTSYYFSFEKYKFIQSFIQHASLAFFNSILKDKLEQIAITDYLTSLYSRNHLDNIIKEQMEEAEYGAFILFDVDDFKQINDTFGHYTGDRVLIQIADILQKEMGPNEVAARWGGEEFAIYLPLATLKRAIEKANEIRKKVNELTNPQVSLSCGVSVWTKNHKDSIEDLFIRTDEALYEAKLTGKNKVIHNILCQSNLSQ